MNLLTPKTHEQLKIPHMYQLSILVLYMHVCLLTQSYLTLSDPLDCSTPGSSVHQIFQAKILERVAISFFMNTATIDMV